MGTGLVKKVTGDVYARQAVGSPLTVRLEAIEEAGKSSKLIATYITLLLCIKASCEKKSVTRFLFAS